MAVHFERPEFEERFQRVKSVMEERNLDALLVFAQESMYWLTGYDTFGYCFFQCLVVQKSGQMTLLTRSADLRQARHTSILEDIRVWVDRNDASPADSLRDLLHELGLLGARLGVEYDTHGLTAANGRAVDHSLKSFANLEDASTVIWPLRAIKSEAELTYAREAGRLGDLALEAGIDVMGAGVNEGKILAAMQGAIFENGGDYAGNEFIIGSGDDALLCRYKSGRRVLDAQDQLTLEFAGAWRHYHAALMRTAIIGTPTDRHLELYEAAAEALNACEGAMRPGNNFGDVFDAHAQVMDGRELYPHRLNACGYSLGAHYTPCWMDWPMFYRGNTAEIVPNMVLFAHMILMDSETNTAMCLGRTYITTEGAPESVSKAPLDLIVIPS